MIGGESAAGGSHCSSIPIDVRLAESEVGGANVTMAVPAVGTSVGAAAIETHT